MALLFIEGALPPYNGAGPEGDAPTGEIGPLGAFEPPIAEGEEDPFKGARHGEEEFDGRIYFLHSHFISIHTLLLCFS